MNKLYIALGAFFLSPFIMAAVTLIAYIWGCPYVLTFLSITTTLVVIWFLIFAISFIVNYIRGIKKGNDNV